MEHCQAMRSMLVVVFLTQERQIHEDEEFSRTLSALDGADVAGPSSEALASPSRPPAKKLKLMMDKIPVGQSPSKTPKTTPTKQKQSERCFVDLVCTLTGHMTCSKY